LESHGRSLGFSWGGFVRLRFGDLTLDPDTRQLLRGGEEVHLPPKAFELLRILVEARPRALSKNELHQHLWPATFVSEANLASLIADLREALGDSARQPRFIRTAHRFGYAFSGEVAEIAGTHQRTDGRGGPSRDPASEAASFCWLIKEGKRLPLRPGENILGRESDAGGVWIDSPTVSRRHACISISASGASLEDLDSKNGTYLRGELVSGPVALTDGDEIRVGSVVLRFRRASVSETATWSDTD
jgi:DNA-binding winged helix-turn-helix (wHTH) protein